MGTKKESWFNVTTVGKPVNLIRTLLLRHFHALQSKHLVDEFHTLGRGILLLLLFLLNHIIPTDGKAMNCLVVHFDTAVGSELLFQLLADFRELLVGHHGIGAANKNNSRGDEVVEI